MRQLHREYQESNATEFLIVYQKEPHAGQLAFREISQPETFEQRVALAKRMKDEYELPMTVLVDSMEDQSRALFSELPSPAFVIDAAGVIREKLPWAEAETIAAAVEKLPVRSGGEERDEGVSNYSFMSIFAIVVVLPLGLVGAWLLKARRD